MRGDDSESDDQKIDPEEDDNKLPDAIRIGAEEGMQDFTMSLKSLIDKELIDRPTAFQVAPNKDALKMGAQRNQRFSTGHSLMFQIRMIPAGLFLVD